MSNVYGRIPSRVSVVVRPENRKGRLAGQRLEPGMKMWRTTTSTFVTVTRIDIAPGLSEAYIHTEELDKPIYCHGSARVNVAVSNDAADAWNTHKTQEKAA